MSRATLEQIADDLAAVLRIGLSGDVTFHAEVPAQMAAQSGHLIPNVDYVTGGATFSRPVVSFEVQISGPTHNFANRQKWLYTKAAEVQRILRTTKQVAGKPTPKPLNYRIGIIEATQGLLGFTMELTPVHFDQEE